MNIRKLFDSSVSYFNEEQADRRGRILPRQFPTTMEVPPHDIWYAMVCTNGRPEKIEPTNELWYGATWQALNFEIRTPFLYKYTYISRGTGSSAMFTARATGDLDCDGVFSTFERVGAVDAENNVKGGAGLFIKNELE